MLRLLFITDYTETFSYRLLKGITNYSEEKGQWSICRMPSSYKNEIGIPGLLKWAKDWEIDAIIGRFEESDNIDLIRDNGIIVVAQDFKKRFKNIPNITADYIGTGRMAARFCSYVLANPTPGSRMIRSCPIPASFASRTDSSRSLYQSAAKFT